MPFHGRSAELAELAEWKNAPHPLAALLVHGPAGSGKTRLVEQVRKDWDDDGKKLLVIDDADRWTWPDLFKELQSSIRGGAHRVLLTSRTTGWWWSSTRQRVADFDYVVTDRPLSPALDNRKRSFMLACKAFAKALSTEPPTQEPPAIADETVLDLHMAALTAVHGDPLDVNRTQLVRQLKARDTGTPQRKLAEDYLAVAPTEENPDLLVHAATRWPQLKPKVDELFTRKGKELVDEVDISTLRALAGIAGLPALEQVARRVFADENFALDALPSMITKRLLDHTLKHSEDLLEQAEMWGNLSARTAIAGLREEAADASYEEVDAYRKLAEQDPENRALLADALGDLSLRLIALERNDEVLKTSEEAIELWKRIAEEDPETLPQLAAAMEQISYRYAALGMPDEAVDAISRAAVMFQGLAEMYPALFRVDFARVASALARRLFTVGRKEEAADAVELSLAHWREATHTDPRYEPELARNLALAGRILADFGRPETAAEAVAEAIEVFRRLAPANPEFTRELADAVMRHSQLLDETGHISEAPLVAEEAVVLWRELATDAEGRAGLATALHNVVLVTRNYDVEIAAATECMELLKELAAEDTVRYQVNYARAIAQHTELLLIGERDDEADAQTARLLEICKTLPQQLIGVYGPSLAGSLHTLGRALSELEHHDQAIAVAEQVIEIWRSLRHRNPAAHIGAVHQLALNLRGAERFEASREAAHFAIVLWHMTKPREELHKTASYGDVLAVYARLCAETRYELENALALAHQAVQIMRGLKNEALKLELAVESLNTVVEAFDDREEAKKRLEALVSSSSAANA
ncbi:hypothetical protein Lesp02_43370 [Lentzea sp. NBRC 105346]|nr:hypothetical protein Lesp02_43370 [Lentzea sp. NBRC 105346]